MISLHSRNLLCFHRNSHPMTRNYNWTTKGFFRFTSKYCRLLSELIEFENSSPSSSVLSADQSVYMTIANLNGAVDQILYQKSVHFICRYCYYEQWKVWKSGVHILIQGLLKEQILLLYLSKSGPFAIPVSLPLTV